MSVFYPFKQRRLLNRAKRAAATGDFPAAAHLLSQSLDRRPDVKLERALVDLLLQAGAASPSGQTVSQTSSPARKDGSNLTGPIPEVTKTDFCAGVLRQAIDTHGYLVVRGFFSSDDTLRVKHCVDEAFGAAVHAAEAGGEDSPWFYRSPHFSAGKHKAYTKRTAKQRTKPSGSTRVIDSPRSVATLLNTYKAHDLASVLQDYFGEPAVIAARKWVFRLIEPIPMEKESIGGGWHQDGQFMGEGVNALNLWVALSACGEGTRTPGIALLPKRFREILEYGTRGARLDWVVGSELVEELAADAPVVCPRFDAGDALFFDHYSLHRSGHGPHQDMPRYALESWFYAQSGTGGNVAVPLLAPDSSGSA